MDIRENELWLIQGHSPADGIRFSCVCVTSEAADAARDKILDRFLEWHELPARAPDESYSGALKRLQEEQDCGISVGRVALHDAPHMVLEAIKQERNGSCPSPVAG